MNSDISNSTSHIGGPDRSPFYILDQLWIDLHCWWKNDGFGRSFFCRFGRRFRRFDFGRFGLLDRLQFLNNLAQNAFDGFQSIGRLVDRGLGRRVRFLRDGWVGNRLDEEWGKQDPTQNKSSEWGKFRSHQELRRNRLETEIFGHRIRHGRGRPGRSNVIARQGNLSLRAPYF